MTSCMRPRDGEYFYCQRKQRRCIVADASATIDIVDNDTVTAAILNISTAAETVVGELAQPLIVEVGLMLSMVQQTPAR